MNIEERRRELRRLFPQWKERTVYQQFVETAIKYPDNAFYIDEMEHSYSEVLQKTLCTIAAFERIGIREGDLVITGLDSRLEFLMISLALSAIGAIKVSVNKDIGSYELEYVVNKTNAKVIVLEHTETIDLSEDLSHRETIISMDSGAVSKQNLICWQEFYNSAAASDLGAMESRFWEKSPLKPCDILFTSGSTGNPKGVVLTSDMLLRSAYANCLNRGISVGHRVCIPIPLHHVYGYVEGILTVILVGGAVIAKCMKFDVAEILRIMERYQAQDMLCVPYIMMKILRYPDLGRFHLEHWRYVYCSASICPSWVWQEIPRKLKINEITTGYGMTETAGAIMQSPPEEAERYLINGYVGKVMDGGCAGLFERNGDLVEYCVIDPETGVALKPNEAGELICRSQVITPGYFGDDSANRKAFDKDGFFHTGDIVKFDEEGKFTFIGRNSDEYKVNGENVSPFFIDQMLSDCEDVVAAQTVGIRDGKLGWVGTVFVESRENTPEARQRIISFCKKNLAPYQVPKYYIFQNSAQWPRTATGKVRKSELRILAEERIQGAEYNMEML